MQSPGVSQALRLRPFDSSYYCCLWAALVEAFGGGAPFPIALLYSLETESLTEPGGCHFSARQAGQQDSESPLFSATLPVESPAGVAFMWVLGSKPSFCSERSYP